MNSFKNFLEDESGQTTTEYVLLLAVVAMIIFKLRKDLGDGLTGLTDGVFGKANSLLQESE